MAKTDPVDVIVRIKDRTKAQLKKIEQRIKDLNEKVYVDINVTDGEVDRVAAKLNSLDGVSHHTVKMHMDDAGFQRRMRNFEKFGSAVPSADLPKLGDQIRRSDGTFGPRGVTDLPATIGNRLPVPADWFDIPDTDMRDAVPGGSASFLDRLKKGTPIGKPGRGNGRSAGRLWGLRTLKSLRKTSDGLEGSLGKLKPTMRKVTNIVAAMLPMLITAGVHLIGIAGAMGAVGVAGASLMGLGLLGMGDSLEESTRKAGERVKELKRDLFEVVNPVATSFSPIADRLFSQIPEDVQSVMPQIGSLRVFEGTTSDSIRGLVEWTGELVATMANLEPLITQLSDRFGNLIGQGVIDFFDWLIRDTHKSQDLFIQLGSVLTRIGEVFWNVSVAVSRLAGDMKLMFDILAVVSKLLKNDFILFAIEAIGITYALGKAVTTAAVAFRVLTAAMKSNPLGLLAVVGSLAASKFLLNDSIGPGPGRRAKPSGAGSGGGNTFVYNDHAGGGGDDFRDLVEGTLDAREEHGEYTER